jgi:hypothetical protein
MKAARATVAAISHGLTRGFHWAEFCSASGIHEDPSSEFAVASPGAGRECRSSSAQTMWTITGLDAHRDPAGALPFEVKDDFLAR